MVDKLQRQEESARESGKRIQSVNRTRKHLLTQEAAESQGVPKKRGRPAKYSPYEGLESDELNKWSIFELRDALRLRGIPGTHKIVSKFIFASGKRLQARISSKSSTSSRYGKIESCK